MKFIPITLVSLLFCLSVKAQSSAIADSIVKSLKIYLSKNIRYPAVAAENEIQGQLIVSFRLNNESRIDEVQVIKPLFAACDSAVIQALRKYPEKMGIVPDTYTFGVQFILEQQGRPAAKVIPFDKSRSDSF